MPIKRSGRGRPKNPPTPIEMLKLALPVADIFNDDELKMYNDLIGVYLNDFDPDELSSSDMDDIMDLAKNRVLEFRLLRESKDNSDRQLDVAQTIDRLSKDNKKLKENLFSRRKDRIRPDEFKGFSIVDLAVAFQNDKKAKMSEKLERLRKEEEVVIKKRVDYTGNRYDTDQIEDGD
jgi:hypothetical protein